MLLMKRKLKRKREKCSKQNACTIDLHFPAFMDFNVKHPAGDFP